jgi:hypothetical protein
MDVSGTPSCWSYTLEIKSRIEKKKGKRRRVRKEKKGSSHPKQQDLDPANDQKDFLRQRANETREQSWPHACIDASRLYRSGRIEGSKVSAKLMSSLVRQLQ